MIRKEKHTVECSNCGKTFPIVLQVDPDNLTGSTSMEVRCPFCEKLLTIDLPGGLSADEIVFRGLKKAE